MSFEVTPDALPSAIEGCSVVYLLTSGERPRPHVGAVSAVVVGGVVRVHGTGRTARGDLGGNPAVTLVGAPALPGGYSLIVDGTATVAGDGDSVHVVPERAVLHRPAPTSPPEPTGGGCSSDCVELPLGEESPQGG